MRNLILYRKLIVLTLATVLLICGVKGICYSQEVPVPSHETMSASEMRKHVLPTVVLIRSKHSSGSGVIIKSPSGKAFVLTNEHVTRGNEQVEVYFLAYDLNLNEIRDSEFYLGYYSTLLRRLGYVTDGRVVADNKETDVAIIHPTGLPKTVKLFLLKNVDVYNDMKKGEQVHFFGHPADQELLWQWNAGHFQGYDKRQLYFEGRPWKGNSGGPVVNKDGELIGITKSIDDVTKAWAVSLEPLVGLVSELEEWYIFSIVNETESTVVYKVNWLEGKTWNTYSLDPGQWNPHKRRTDTPGVIKPKILYIPTPQQDPQAPVNTDTEDPEFQSEETLGNITNTEHEIKNIKRQFFSSDVTERIIPKLDGYNYRFIDTESKKIELQEPRQTVWIANHTTDTQSYKIKWSASRLDEENYTLEPGKTQPHWSTRTQTELLANYPKIQIEYYTIDYASNTKYSGTIEKSIITTIVPEFFPIDAKTDEHIMDIGDIKKSNKYGIGYYHFRVSPENGAFEILDDLPIPEENKPFTWWKKKSGIFGIPSWIIWIIDIVGLTIIGVVGYRKFFAERYIFSILNNTEGSIDYEVKWIPNKDWNTYSLDPGKELPHSHSGSLKKVPQDYPKVRFNTKVDDKKETKEQTLETYTCRLGPKGIKKISREKHAREYHFEIDSETKMLNLVDSETDNE